MSEAPSPSAVRKAGSRIRAHGRGDLVDPELYERSISVIEAYRSEFGRPLNSVAMGLRSMTRTLEIDAEVSQRLKRKATIIEKLQRREDAHDLSRMGDIGGCRAVVPTRGELWALVGRARRQWRQSIKKEMDYIGEPQPSGYRAFHMLVERHGRIIEVQFRDVGLHEWAQLVEAISMVTRENYKQEGESVVQQYMLALSELDRMHESGLMSDELAQRAATLRVSVIESLASLVQGEGGRDG